MRLHDREILDFLLEWMAHEGYRVAGKGPNRENLSRVAVSDAQISRVGVFLEMQGRDSCPDLLTPGEKRANLGLSPD